MSGPVVEVPVATLVESARRRLAKDWFHGDFNGEVGSLLVAALTFASVLPLAGYALVDLAFLKPSGESLLWAVYLTLLSAAILIAAVLFQREMRDLVRRSQEWYASDSGDARELAPVIRGRGQIGWMIGGAIFGFVLYFATAPLVAENLDVSGALVMATTVAFSLTAAGVHAGLHSPTIVRQIVELEELRLHAVRPADTPILHAWSSFFSRYSIWAVLQFVLLVVPLLIYIGLAPDSQRVVLAVVGLSASLVGLMAMLWMGVAPNRRISRAVQAKKYSMLTHRENRIRELEAEEPLDGRRIEEIEYQLQMMDRIRDSPNSPARWLIQAAASLVLALTPALVGFLLSTWLSD